MTRRLTALVAVLTTLSGAAATMATQGAGRRGTPPPRPQGPCDIYAAAGDPCVAAHSTTRALYAGYNGPLYRVLRQSDGKTLDIGVVQAGLDAGGYADAAAQDAFCANTYCWITTIYDQSASRNDLTQAPRGGFSGPAMGGFNNLPLADMAPVTIMGHKVYGVFIEPGMGLRNDDPRGTAVDDQAEGQYWVINGHHYNSGCCFDYGNAETDSRDDGNGTMETTYFGNAGAWYHGPPPGPWVMTDQENNLVGCVNADRTKACPDLPNITWRFVTAMAKGEPHHWTSLGGDAQRGALRVMFDGPRVDASYDPMRKQGAILLGNGGDNSNGSQGTFYEGAMTAAGTFPTDATDQLIQANVVAARYDVAAVNVAPALATTMPPGVQTFAPGSSQDVTVTFTNTTGGAVPDGELSLVVPARWRSVVRGPSSFTSVPPGSSVSATFEITSGPTAWNGDIVGSARWTDATGARHSESAAEKVRNVFPIKINEFQVAAGAPANSTNSFIELYNSGRAGEAAVDLSNWTLTAHGIQQVISSTVKIPAGTKLAAGGFYLLGLSNSGLAAAARKGETTIHVRSTTGMTVGDSIVVDTGSGTEARTVAGIGTPAANGTTIWQPLPDGPVMTLPAGSTSVPVTSVAGFVVGEKVALGYGAMYPVVARTIEKFEIATVTAVGKPGTQGRLAAAAPAGSSTLRVTAVDNISAGDRIRLDIASVGHGVEWVTVTAVGTAGANGTGVAIAEKLKFDHASNMPFSDRGTGISISPATAFAHSSNEPVQALGSGITLDRPLTNDHAIDAVVRDERVTTAGYQGSASAEASARKAPDQWFGGPALSAGAGSIVLRDASGLVVDTLNYGGLVDPWAAEGYQATSGAGQSGCRAPVPSTGSGPGRAGGGGAGGGFGVNRSTGRFPDGADTDSNCTDFLTQIATTMPAGSAAGATNIKVASVADFAVGHTIIVDTGADAETAVIASVGTAGATTVSADAAAGATMITVATVAGFSAGQPITIGSGANAEAAVVLSSAGGRGGGRGGAPTAATITLAAPLTLAHAAGAQVSGTGITLTAALSRAHASGAPVATSAPTPGAPNKYARITSGR
ncbi:MAG TPA: arabinofuranosidase catalytic domain-containing protein [Vicinamibacterales bacterium]|nr:arabinofuranosidase catalytic domain-containing protein [Vicinamibacterales bacterium]